MRVCFTSATTKHCGSVSSGALGGAMLSYSKACFGVPKHGTPQSEHHL